MKERRTVKMPLKRPPTRVRKVGPKLRARAAVDDEDVEDYEGEAEPNMRFSHALFVVLILHVIAVAGVFAFNSIKANQAEKPTTALEGALPASPTKAEALSPIVKQAPEAPKNAEGTHTVVAGETLGKIAAQYKTTVEAFEKANGITSRSLIRVGQVLTLPLTGAAPKAAIKSGQAVDKTANKPGEAPAKVPAKSVQSETKAPASQGIISSVAKPVEASKPKPEAAPPAGEALPADGTYTVAKGDNPYSIARRYHVSYQDLLTLNNIEDPTKIQIGQKLKIPKPGN